MYKAFENLHFMVLKPKGIRHDALSFVQTFRNNLCMSTKGICVARIIINLSTLEKCENPG